MKNPLRKRYLRDLRQEFGKYLVIFLFITLTIAFISGFLVADGSMRIAYDQSFEKYNIEDGHFTVTTEGGNSMLQMLMNSLINDSPAEEWTKNGWIKDLKDMDVAVYENKYMDEEMKVGKETHTIRLFPVRTQVNLSDLMKGKMPEKNDEIVIDRLYAENNGLETGDILTIQNREFKITGMIALSDYSALFKNNTDMMFDAQKFTVAEVMADAFESLDQTHLKDCYAWKYLDKSLTEQERKDKSEDVKDLLMEKATLTDFVAREDNQAINFTGDDMGGDAAMMTALLYIIMAVLAFIFAVTTSSTIEKESTVIGTLRASGYTKGELIRHYMTLPVIVTLVAALIGNILGYTVLKYSMAAMYYGSYSLPTYHTVWNAEAFVKTTVVPCLIMAVVNLLILRRKLALSPLKFLRRDLKKKQKKRLVRLPNFPFLTRFRLRIIFQNIPIYFMLLLGIMFANILLSFGMAMGPLLSHYKEEVKASEIAKYQYILKGEVDTKTEGAEKYSVTSLETGKDADSQEEVTVYGISSDSQYLKDLDLPKYEGEIQVKKDQKEIDGGDAIFSEGLLNKMGLKVGDDYVLYSKYEKKNYKFHITGSYNYPAAMSVFIYRTQFNDVFEEDEDSYNGYFCNQELSDVKDDWIASKITEHDLTVLADQLDDSVGAIMPMFSAFSVLMYMLIIYLLSKIVLEKNAGAISMVKILGYSNKEIGKLYIAATAIMTVLSQLISLPIAKSSMYVIFLYMMTEMKGWITFYIRPTMYPEIFVIGVVSFAVISFFNYRKIQKIPMEEALKNAE